MQERQAALAESRKQTRSDNPDVEAKANFFRDVADAKAQIANLLETSPGDNIEPWADRIKEQIARIEKVTAQYAYVLPSYDIEVTTKDIVKFRETLAAKQSEVAPKKKFSFKAKTVVKAANTDSSVVSTIPEGDSASTPLTPDKFPGVFDLTHGSDIRLEAGSDQIKLEHVITRCSGSQVALCHPMGALRIQNIRDSVIVVGPVSGAIYVIDCVNCKLVLSSHQIRIHDCYNCDMYMRVGSRPIIEHCSDVRFAPYSLSYPSIERHFQEVGVTPLPEGWREIQDFGWLKTTASPNWHELEPEKRQSFTVNDDRVLNVD